MTLSPAQPSTPGAGPVIGVFGGSFNPPHMGHVLACHFALAAWQLNKVFVVPSYKHPFGKNLESFEHRLEMLRLALQHLGEFVMVSDIERQLGGVSYTVETLRELHRLHPGTALRLIIGSDIIDETSKWYQFNEIQQLAPLLVIPRTGTAAANSPVHYLPEISSTTIRAQLANQELVGLAIPTAVQEYIRANRLYQVDAPQTL